MSTNWIILFILLFSGSSVGCFLVGVKVWYRNLHTLFPLPCVHAQASTPPTQPWSSCVPSRPQTSSQATKYRLGICIYTLSSCYFSFSSKWSARCITCSSVYKEDFPSSLSFKVTLECGYNAALSVLSYFHVLRWLNFIPSSGFFLLPQLIMRSSLQPQVWAGRRLLPQL